MINVKNRPNIKTEKQVVVAMKVKDTLKKREILVIIEM
jgi:hypothetical protein